MDASISLADDDILDLDDDVLEHTYWGQTPIDLDDALPVHLIPLTPVPDPPHRWLPLAIISTLAIALASGCSTFLLLT